MKSGYKAGFGYCIVYSVVYVDKITFIHEYPVTCFTHYFELSRFALQFDIFCLLLLQPMYSSLFGWRLVSITDIVNVSVHLCFTINTSEICASCMMSIVNVF
jgi:hypothetical protein